MVTAKVREGGIDQGLKSRKRPDVLECGEAEDSVLKKSQMTREKYADIVIY